jgi:hypothetical protein
MNKQDAKSLLKKLTRSCINISGHCKQRMSERDVSIHDILYVIMWGSIESIEKDLKHNNWKCTVKGEDIEGDELTIILGIYENTGIVQFITVC